MDDHVGLMYPEFGYTKTQTYPRRRKTTCNVEQLHNSLAELYRMTRFQMIETEMEKKHQKELLLQILKQRLEMQELKRQLDFPTSIKDPPTLRRPEPNLQSEKKARHKLMRQMGNFWGTDVYDTNSFGAVNDEEWTALSMDEERPYIPKKLRPEPACVLLSNDTKKMNFHADLKNKKFPTAVLEQCNLNETVDETSAALPSRNLAQIINTMYTSTMVSRHDNIPKRKLFKTEMCRSWTTLGWCTYGNRCSFAHGRAELRLRPKRNSRYKTKPCMKFLAGDCRYGSRCSFVH